MHEMSVAMEICRIAERRVGRDGLSTVRELGIRVGERAGVVAENLVFCLEVLVEQPPFEEATVAIERCPGDELRLEYLMVED